VWTDQLDYMPVEDSSSSMYIHVELVLHGEPLE
jgi:hypothetical protein